MKRIELGCTVSVVFTLLVVGLAVYAAPFPIAVTDETGNFVTMNAEPHSGRS